MARLCCLALLLSVVAVAVRAQPVLSEDAQVSLVTILPGEAVYSIYGHSAVRVYDPTLDLDLSFNYGTFDFGNPLVFVGQFAYGKLDYFLSVHDHPRAVEVYWDVEHRPIVEQVLGLSPGQRQALFRYLWINAQPENRTYRYDFLFDNCSTRIRDAVEAVLGDSLHFGSMPDPEQSFRRLIAPYAVEKPFLNVAMNLGLGLPADRIATPRETMFLPLYLKAAFDHAEVTVDGVPRPLVARTDTLVWSDERATLDPAGPWPLVLAWGVFIGLLLATLHDLRRDRLGRRYVDALLYGGTGLAGLLIVFLWFISLHTVTAWNVNLLWLLPTQLVAAVPVIRSVEARWLAWYLAAAAALALVVVLGWPFWPQGVPGVVVPLALGVAVRCGAQTYLRLRKR